MLIQPGALQFTEYLKQLPPSWVLEHFFNEDTSTRKILSSAMVEESARQFATQEELHRRFVSLSEDDRLRCAQMYLMGASGVSSELTTGLDDPIVASFLGFAAKDTKGQARIFGFNEFVALLEPDITSTILSTSTRSDDHSPIPVWNWRSCNDISLVVSLGGQHLLVRKRSGKLGMAALQIIKKLIHTGELHRSDDIAFIALQIVEYCLSRGLLIADEKEFRLGSEQFDKWLQRPIMERRDEIIDFITTNCGKWNIVLLKKICAEAESQWISYSHFSKKDQPYIRAVLLALQFAGVLEVYKRGNDLLFQCVPETVSEMEPEGQSVVIMPDFSLILSQECRPEILFSFARYCKVKSLDRVYHGCIDKKVLIEALSTGMESERIIGSLESWNAPDNVLESVREWIREFFRLSLLTENTLITSEEQVTAQITSYTPLRPYLEQVPAHALFRIKPGSEKIVRDIIKKLGFDDRIPQRECAVTQKSTFEIFQKENEIEEWTLISEDNPDAVKTTPAMRGTKYGAELKALELSEVVQVIDYAILTSQQIAFSYEGSPYVRKGIYTVRPILCGKGAEPMLDGELQRTGSRKQFYIKKIAAIGVVPQ